MLRLCPILLLIPCTVLAQPINVPMMGHTERVYAVAVSPDGKTLATGSFDKTVKLWDATSAKEFRTIGGANGHTNTITALAFHPKEATLATASTDNTVRLWDIKRDKPAEAAQKTLQHPQLVNCLGFNASGTTLATGGQDGILRFWDMTKKEPGTPKTITAHETLQPKQAQAIYALVWLPDGKQIITASNDRSIKVWDVEGLKLVREIKPGADKPPPTKEFRTACAVVFPGAATALVNLPPSQGHTDQVYTLALSADGKTLASGGADRQIKLWNPATGEHIRSLKNDKFKPKVDSFPTPSHPGFVQAVVFSNDGKSLISVGTAPRNKGFLAVWNVADGVLKSGEEYETGAMYAVTPLPDNRLLIGCGPKLRGATESDAYLWTVK
jgi:WD domain, G-beta repeat